MEKEIKVTFFKNGYSVKFEGFSKNNGELVYRFKDELKMIEDIGLYLTGEQIVAISRADLRLVGVTPQQIEGLRN